MTDQPLTGDYDVIIVGAGFAGLYQLKVLRDAGWRVHAYEAGDGVGGTWYWNRYPGARCDIESIEYSYSFDQQLEQDWTWSERFAAQPELLRYAEHVADRFDLLRDITLSTRVVGMNFGRETGLWSVTLDSGETVRAQFVVAATGCLSVPSQPQINGLDEFAGEVYYTSQWPHDGVDLRGKKVAVIGTGSSGIQTITAIAGDVAQLTVFQRTANFSVPAHNRPLTAAEVADVKSRYPQIRELQRTSRSGFSTRPGTTPMSEVDQATAEKAFEARWARGGLGFTGEFPDTLVNPDSNERAAEFVRAKIGQIVADPQVAQRLQPRTFPIGSKRLCVDTGYYEVYNQPNVELVDIRTHPIEQITAGGVQVAGTEYGADVLIFATGFDAMTGAVEALGITCGDLSLADAWTDGPRTYLGLMVAGFPNLFVITGPGSPSVLTNMIVSIEFHCDWVGRTLEHLREHDLRQIEATQDAQDAWAQKVDDQARMTLMPQANSWYMGANIPGKRQMFMPYIGGHAQYAEIVDGAAADGYRGFRLQ